MFIDIKQAFAPVKPNTIRIILSGPKKNDRLVLQINMKYFNDVFKKGAIKLPWKDK